MSGEEAWILPVNANNRRDARAKRRNICFMAGRVKVKRQEIYINKGGYASARTNIYTTRSPLRNMSSESISRLQVIIRKSMIT
jgi:hypothetical protein